MLKIEVLCNCYKKLKLPDDHLVQFLNIILGDPYRVNDYDDIISLYFKEEVIHMCSHSSLWETRLDTEDNYLDLLLTREQYTLVRDYLIREYINRTEA